MQLTFLGEAPLSPRALSMITLMLFFGVRLAARSPLALSINECCVCVEIAIFQLAHWQCDQELEECSEPLEKLSLLLESSTEATIHNTSDYFLALLYHKLEYSPKRGTLLARCPMHFLGTFEPRF